MDNFVRSTAVARVNGFVGGHGGVAEVRAVLDPLGLSARGQQELLEVTEGRP